MALTVSSVVDSGTAPSVGTRRAVLLKPTMPHRAAGMRSDPPVSEPRPMKAAPVATETSYGELAEVGYFVKWEGARASLRRLFVNPSRPDSASATGVSPNENFLIYKNPRWLSDTLVKAVAPATPPAFKGLFADNVVGSLRSSASRLLGCRLLQSVFACHAVIVLHR